MDYITPDKFLYNMRLSAQIEWLLTMDLFYTVRLDNGATLIASAAGDMELRKGEWCVFRRDFSSTTYALMNVTIVRYIPIARWCTSHYNYRQKASSIHTSASSE